MNANFRGKGASPTNDFWHQKSRVPVLSYCEKIAEKFNRLSRVHQRHGRQTTDKQQTDGIAMASSEREREFTSAKNHMSKLHESFYTCYLCLLLGPPLNAMQLCYVLPALQTTSRFHVMAPMGQSKSRCCCV